MNIRPIDLLDLPTLSRYRNDSLPLDSTRALTRGIPMSTGGFFAPFNLARHLYTAISNEDGTSLLGSVANTRGETFARLLYLAPTTHLTHPSLPMLIEHLSAEAGTWGAFHVLAEVEESSDAFPALRNSGFAVHAWQRIWDISSVAGTGTGRRAERVEASDWKRARDIDLNAIQSLYHQIVPPLLQFVESSPRRAAGFVCDEGIRCYVSPSSGSMGIVLTPLIHPDASHVGSKLAALISTLPDRRGRPVYMCVRSYQAWLEPALADLGASASARQAVMVKHLARQVKEEQAVTAVQPASVSVQPSQIETKK